MHDRFGIGLARRRLRADRDVMVHDGRGLVHHGLLHDGLLDRLRLGLGIGHRRRGLGLDARHGLGLLDAATCDSWRARALVAEALGHLGDARARS